MESLPHELIAIIFSYLLPADAARLSTVSNLIRSAASAETRRIISVASMYFRINKQVVDIMYINYKYSRNKELSFRRIGATCTLYFYILRPNEKLMLIADRCKYIYKYENMVIVSSQYHENEHLYHKLETRLPKHINEIYCRDPKCIKMEHNVRRPINLRLYY